MRKALLNILIFCMVICFSLCIFTACDNSALIPSDSETNQEQNINDNGGDDNSTQDHTHVYNETVVNPTCTEQGYTLHSCTICSDNYKDTYTAALGHNYEWTTTKEPTETEKGVETGICSRCKGTTTRDIPELNHEHSYHETVIAPTCTEKGYTLHKCSCGAEYRTDETDIVEHTYQTEIIEPKCTEQGYTLHVCSKCGYNFKDTYTNETGHDYGDWVETIAPTCTEEGEMQRVCRKDSTHKETMTITPTGHKFSNEWTYDSGYHYHASTCGHNVVSDRNAHDFKTDIINVTCDTDGYTLHTCKTCGYFYTDNVIPATGHSYSNEWTTDDDYHWHAATCGHNLAEDKTAHNFGAPTTVTPSCETDGYDYKICSDCGYELRYNIVPALGHLKSDVKVKTLVKASDSGYGYYTKEFSCERCNQVISSQYTMIQPNGATTNSAQGEWEENTVFSNVPYPQNGVCVSLVTSTENTAVGSYQGTVGAIFENITRDQVKTYTQTLKSYGYRKTVSEQDYYAYSFTAYHNTLNIFIAVGFDGSEMSIAAYKTGTVKKASNSGSGSSGTTVMYDISATDGLSYALSLDGKSYSVTGYNGTEDYVIIPFKVNGLPVKSISGRAFKNNTIIKAIIILSDIETIGSDAFNGCSSLTSINIPDSIIDIDDDAFDDCDNLTYSKYDNAYYLGNENNPYLALITKRNISITSCKINEHTNIIAGGAFSSCGELTKITIPDSVISIGRRAFSYCSKLTDITFYDSVLYVGRDLFGETGYAPISRVYFYGDISYLCNKGSLNCSLHYSYYLYINGKSATEIIIPNTVKEICESAFKGCLNIQSIIIPESVTSIGAYAFANCNSLKNIIIPNGVTCIEDGTFNNCGSLTNATIPNSVVSIGYSAFCRCNGLQNITIPDSITNIGSYAFYNCSKINSITIPNSITSIGESAFSCCSESLYNKFDNAYYLGNENNPYLVLVKAINSTITSCDINTNTKFICGSGYNERDAFSNCTKLVNMIIPDSVVNIGGYAFNKCSMLTNLNIGNSVTSIGYGAFEECGSLSNIIIPDSVTSIEDWAFCECRKLISITISDNITSIGENAFANCYGLTTVIYGGNIDKWAEISFENCTSNPLYFAKNLFINGQLVSEIHLATAIKISDYAFYGYNSLTDITISGSVISIGNYAFFGCNSLTSATIGNGVTSIGYYAFDACSSLTEITIPDLVTSIGYGAFFGCNSLTKVSLGRGVMSIGAYAFKNCNNLTEIIIHSSVTTIEDDVFYGCSSLTRVSIPDSVLSIEIYAFYNCSSLTSVTIGDGVTSIGSNAFAGCSGLSSVYYTGSADDWSKIKIGNENTALTSATRYYYSENEPALNGDGTAYDGNYWHYAPDGTTPIIWVKEN